MSVMHSKLLDIYLFLLTVDSELLAMLMESVTVDDCV